MKRLLLCTLAAASLISLGACSTTSPDVIKREDAQRMSTIQDGILLSTRPVKVEGSQSGVGGVTGAVVGGVAGSSVGGRREHVVAGALGAVAGAVIGNMVERSATQEEAVEMLVQLKNGDRRAIVQAKGTEALQPGDQVIIVTTGNKVRVTRAPAGTPPIAGANAPIHTQR